MFSFIILLAVITFIHYLSLKIQAKYRFYTKKFGQYGFPVHFLITGILWIYLFFLYIARDLSFLKFPVFYSILNPLGHVFQLTGTLLVIWSFLLLGIRRAWGIRYFDDNYKNRIEKRGPYKYLSNPIYDGFILFFSGKALVFNSFFYLFISVECFVLFNILLARFENSDIILQK